MRSDDELLPEYALGYLALLTARKVASAGFLQPQTALDPLGQASILHLLVQVAAAHKLAKVRFDIDKVIADGFSKRLTHCRDAACHFTSQKQVVETNWYSWNVLATDSDFAIQFGQVELKASELIAALNLLCDHFRTWLRKLPHQVDS